jgi:hypothetical protein
VGAVADALANNNKNRAGVKSFSDYPDYAAVPTTLPSIGQDGGVADSRTAEVVLNVSRL